MSNDETKLAVAEDLSDDEIREILSAGLAARGGPAPEYVPGTHCAVVFNTNKEVSDAKLGM